MKPAENATLLDLGSGSGTFSTLIAERCAVRVTMADVLDHSSAAAEQGAAFVQVTENGALPFSDGAFDIVLCNSVIEHATDPGSAGQGEVEWRSKAWRTQSSFATEIRRVGKGYFVQTPHKDFPIDVHLWLPFTNWLRHESLERLRPWVNRHWMKGCDRIDWNLLRTHDMQTLFPDATIHVERFLGMPKSILAYRNSRYT